MISYAQNLEDVVLARVFTEPTGFYIDVGAASPVVHSVTKHFYDRGWRGINIDPVSAWHDALMQARPDDINLRLGVSDESGTLELYVTPESAGESTFAADVAQRLRSDGLEAVAETVPVRTLAAICREHVTVPIDFLKIDVEGWELAVVAGADWRRFRPTVVVLESRRPRTLEPVDLDTPMSAAGYRLALFDGLNRFYVREEDQQLLPELGTPANVTDGYVTAEVHHLDETVKRLVAEAEFLRAQLDPAARATAETVVQQGREITQTTRELAAAEALLATMRAQRASSTRELRDARLRATDAELQFHATRDALDSLLSAQADPNASQA